MRWALVLVVLAITVGHASAQPGLVVPAGPTATPAVDTRVGVDGALTIGPVVTAGASVRYERGSSEYRFIARLGYLRGGALEDEGGDGFDAIAGHIGVRAYAGHSLYLDLELGGTAIRHRAYTGDDGHDPADWLAIVSGSAGIGVKLDRVELGVVALFPFVGAGAYLGVDFVAL